MIDIENLELQNVTNNISFWHIILFISTARATQQKKALTAMSNILMETSLPPPPQKNSFYLPI